MIHPRTLQSLEYDKIVQYLESLCQTSAGRELARSLKPLEKTAQAESALRLYEESAAWAGNTAQGKDRFAISPFPDVQGILAASRDRTLQADPGPASLDVDAFWALREMLRQAQKAVASISTPGSAELWPNLLALAQAAPLPLQLLAALNRCISDDGYLKDESTPELYRIRSELRGIHQNCLRKVKEFAQKYNLGHYLQDEFMTLSSDRYVLPLKANFKGRLQGIIHDWSQTGETCYFEPIFLVEVNNRLRELKHEEREEERRVLQYLADLLDSELAGAEAANDLLARLDFLAAKRLYADYLHCNVATFAPAEEGVELLGARHPILILSRLRPGRNLPDGVRPLDIILRPGERALVLTGGNAGGKTVCLKSMGLIAALAMSGLPVPVSKGSHLPWLERIDAFIGDEQSISDNLSTFTAHIEHLAKAWKYLDGHALALLDEFGAGTDPAEGSALAQAVMDQLLEKGCFVLSATHFPALKSYALSREGVRAASMLFDPASGKPLFKLAYGQVGSSQALRVAAEHGLPEAVLAGARRYLLQDGEDSSALLERLNSLAAQREKEIADLRAQEEKAAAILKEKKEKLDRERARILDEIRSRMAELSSAWREGRATAKKTMKEMSGLRAELGLPEHEEKSILPRASGLVPGQKVLHAAFNKRGVVTDIDEKRERARVDLDGVRLWADLKDLRIPGVEAGKKPAQAPARGGDGASMSLDCRGMRADEAIAATEAFLDKAIMAGFASVEIIHGRGTGALRRQLHQYLGSFPGVAGFALAPEDRGGDGMTIVDLV